MTNNKFDLSEETIRQEFDTTGFRSDIGFDISLCGLCANCGVVDTRESAVWNKQKVGLIAHCICPNGRTLKKMKPNLSVEDMETIRELVAQKKF